MIADDRRRSILLVDDESDVIESLVPLLEKDGLTVTSFTDSQLAYDHVRQTGFDYHALVADVRMPAMNGFELARRLKMLKPQLKTILITGFEINSITLDKLKDSSEVDHVLYKPVSAKSILGLL